jgi:diguanylate cyclase (GGDEF)-like protein
MTSLPTSVSALEAKDRVTTALQRAWSRGSAESSPLTVLLVSFDTTATDVGVEILERAMNVHCARTNDVVLRRSSDEFIAILPDTSPQGARRVGEQILEAMRTADDDHLHRVSVGLAVAVPDEHRAARDLLRRAQSALEAAHDKGGDTCVGGATSGGHPPDTPKGPLARLRELLPKNKKDTDFKRRTD